MSVPQNLASQLSMSNPSLAPTQLSATRLSAVPQQVTSAPLLSQVKSLSAEPVVEVDIIVKEGDFEVEEVLKHHKYFILKRIFINSESGVVARYIKAFDKNGHVVYIEPDVDGSIMRGEEEAIYQEKNGNIPIPYSYKTGTIKCVETDACGVVFECNGSYCTVRANPTDVNMPMESLYCEAEVASTEVMFDESHVTAYPIVRLSEILENPELVCENIERVSHRILEVTYNLSREALELGRVKLCRLVKFWNKYSHLQDCYLAELKKVKIEIYALKCEYEKKDCLDECQKKCYLEVLYNLYTREHDLNRLIKKNLKVGLMLQELCEFTEDLKHYKKEIYEMKLGVEKNHALLP